MKFEFKTLAITSALLLAVGATVLLTVSFQTSSQPASPSSATQAASSVAAVTDETARLKQIEQLLNVPDPAIARAKVMQSGSIIGTAPDGQLVCQANGTLQPSMQVRRHFDYWLASIGDAARDEIRVVMLHHLVQQSGQHCVLEAARLFDSYTALLEEQSKFSVKAKPSANATERIKVDQDALARLKSLRQERLGPAWANAFFADEYALLERTASTPLDAAQTWQVSQEQSSSITAQVEQVRQQYGAEAAQRLEHTLQAQAAWQTKLDQLKAFVLQLRADHTLNAEQREQRVAQYIEQRFTGTERERAAGMVRSF